jgi:hypothetical protein
MMCCQDHSVQVLRGTPDDQMAPCSLAGWASGKMVSCCVVQVTKDCISSIADSSNFGGIYQEIFRACNVTGG